MTPRKPGVELTVPDEAPPPGEQLRDLKVLGDYEEIIRAIHLMELTCLAIHPLWEAEPLYDLRDGWVESEPIGAKILGVDKSTYFLIRLSFPRTTEV